MVGTRFNPSINGPAHLGHLYMALVNQHYAHERGGQFMVRFDDDHFPSLKSIGHERMERMAERMRDELEWAGLAVDEWQYESKMLLEARSLVKERCPDLAETTPPQPSFYATYQQTPLWVGGHSLVYPYAPQLALTKVMLDHMTGVTHLIRGDELMTEVSLYSYFCDRLGLPTPQFIYIPRLRSGAGEVSKHSGTGMLCQMRAYGYRAADVLEILAEACLVNPANGWELTNLKERPSL